MNTASVWPLTYYTGQLVGVAETRGSNSLFAYETAPTQSATRLSYGPFAKVSKPWTDTQVFVQNTSGVFSAKVKLYVLNPDGSVVQTLVDWACPQNLLKFTLAVMNYVPSQFQGSVKVESQDAYGNPGPGIVSVVELNPHVDTYAFPIAAYTAFNR
jgi:hypothetical protein